jgi:DNA-directed RNA polymerase-3 subunit RPC5
MDPDDKVVAELDVFVCNHLKELNSKLVLLQHPLRPTWRPYENSADTAARFKPLANRLELTIPFNHQEGPNYNPDVEEAKKAGALTLRSTAVDSANTSLAVGVIKDGALLLLPVDHAYQMRPQLQHLDTAAAGAGGKDETDEEMEEAGAEVKPELTALEVQIKRRETERQVAARQRSYAYLQQQEETEAWKPLEVHSDGSAVSEALKAKMLAVEQQPGHQQPSVGPLLSRAAYLAALSPVSGTTPAAGLSSSDAAALAQPGSSAAAGPSGLGGGNAGAAAGAAAGGAGPSGLGGGAGAGAGGANDLQEVTPALAAALGPALRGLFRASPVNNLGDVRRWLGSEWDVKKAGGEEAAGLVRQGAFLTDAALSEFLAGPAVEGLPGSGCHEHIRGSYIQKGAGPAGCEHLRVIVLQMLRTKASLKKSEVLATAQAAGVPANEGQYQKVMKELCRNHGNNWTLKTGRNG